MHRLAVRQSFWPAFRRPKSQAIRRPSRSNAEDFCVARLDGLAFLLYRRRVVLHGLDVLERLAPRLLARLRMHRAEAADIDDELLRLAAEAERLEQPCRVRIGRI